MSFVANLRNDFDPISTISIFLVFLSTKFSVFNNLSNQILF